MWRSKAIVAISRGIIRVMIGANRATARSARPKRAAYFCVGVTLFFAVYSAFISRFDVDSFAWYTHSQ